MTEKKEFIQTKKITNSDGPWKKHQLVNHKKFGVGTIKEIEKKDDNQFYITAIFNCGEKKILSNFLSPLQKI